MNFELFDAAADFVSSKTNDAERAFRFACYFGENASMDSNLHLWWENFENPVMDSLNYDHRTVRV